MKKKIIKFIKSYKLIYLLTLIAFIYFSALATNRYDSTAKIGVKSTNTQTDTSTLIPLIGLSSSSKEDIMYLQEFITSYDMLKVLQKDLDIKSMYRGHIDVALLFYDLDVKEDFLAYYQKRVSVNYDDITGLLSIQAQAFSPEDALLIAKTILNESEKFVNEISHKIAREQMSFANEELEKAFKELSKAQENIAQFQNQNTVLDPLSQAQAQALITNQIQEKIISKEVELSTLNSYLNANTPKIMALKSEINALKSQLKKEQNKLTSKDKDEKLNQLAIEFSNLGFKVKFAEQAYKLALASYEKSRLEANKKLKQLVIINSPNKSEKPAYPSVLYDTFAVFFILTLVFGIIKFTYSIIEEHKY